MRNIAVVLMVLAVLACLLLSAGGRAAEQSVTVAAYYFGNYHPGDPRNETLKGYGWSEWDLVKAARPRFAGEHQPNVPSWGYEDESDPQVMGKKIAAAADHGIGAFIFDWYYYNDGPFLQGALERGFLKAPNNGRVKFALMWANHDWLNIHPYQRGAPLRVLYPGTVTPKHFQKICDYAIRTYFLHPSYWRIEGKPYFSFYDLSNLVANFGSVAATRAALDKFRSEALAAGLPGLHLNAVVWGQPVLPGEKVPADPVKLVSDLGFDSVTSYVWFHHVDLPEMQTDYNLVRDQYLAYWDKVRKIFKVPYYPNVTMGWDPSPRAYQSDTYGNFGYPFTNTISGNTPERFREVLRLTRERLLAEKNGPRIVTLNAWNEWTEGSYLEPDSVHGMQYLDAVRAVFGRTSPPPTTVSRTSVAAPSDAAGDIITLSGTATNPAAEAWFEVRKPGASAPGIANELSTELIVQNVSRPTLQMFPPDPKKATGAAMIVIPGGGFVYLGMGSSYDVARWLNERGIAAFVLKYRLAPSSTDSTPSVPAKAVAWRRTPKGLYFAWTDSRLNTAMRQAQQDGLEAIRYVRTHAAQWKLSPERIGVIGFSAGALTAVNMGVHADSASKPDLIASFYGSLVDGSKLTSELPPAFIATAADDVVAPADASLTVYDAWRSVGIPAELHVFENGGHGFGLTQQHKSSDQWPALLEHWLLAHRFASIQ